MAENNLSGDYPLFLKMVGINQEVWLLLAMEGAYAMFEDPDGRIYLPVWHDEESARLHIEDEWENYKAEKMPLNEFLKWLDELKRDNIMIAMLSLDKNKTIPVIPEDLKTHLIDQINNKL